MYKNTTPFLYTWRYTPSFFWAVIAPSCLLAAPAPWTDDQSDPDEEGGHGEHQHWRHRLDDRQHCVGHVDDPGAGLLLRWPRASQERPFHHDAVLHAGGGDQHPVGVFWLQSGVRPGSRRIRRRPELGWPSRGGTGSESRLRGHHPPSTVHGLPDDVRHHHPGPHHRCLRRAHEVQRFPHLLSAVGHDRL